MPILKASWNEDGTVSIKGGIKDVVVPVKEVPISQIVKPEGNTKTEGVVGIINDLSHGCFRSLTGFTKSELPCYADAEMGESGCYANETIYANLRKSRGYNVVSNGIDNDFMTIKIPKGSWSLEKWGHRKLWREASETSDSSLAIALGLTRRWAEANPWAKIIGISSNYFRPEDSELEALARLDNAPIIGHTIADWFSEEDLQNRIVAIRRYKNAEVPTAIWIATHPDWDNQRVADMALDIVHPEDIIEVPYHDTKNGHSIHSLRINPKGMCSDVWRDRDGNRIDIESMTVTVDGETRLFEGGKSIKCRGCRLLCGVTYSMKKTPSAV